MLHIVSVERCENYKKKGKALFCLHFEYSGIRINRKFIER